MAKGRPDFFGVQQFPSFGPLESDGGSISIPASGLDVVIDVSAKGVSDGGFLRLKCADLDAWPTITVTIDGTGHDQFLQQEFDDLLLYGYEGRFLKLHLSSYHYGQVIFEFREGVTFAESVSVLVTNNSAANTVSGDCVFRYFEVKD
jgi:hypothetical protein